MTKHLLFLLCVLGACVSCNMNAKYEHFHTIAQKGWDKDSTLTFPVHFNGDQQGYDLKLHIRHKKDYEFSNIWLFVNIESPQGEQLIDTVEFTLAEPSGRWLGSGLGDLFYNELPYKQNVAFPDSGTYNIRIQQAMRDELLNGIDAIGVSIEKTK
ncbi:MAG: gliding motility lipoprotein GldH [Mangrovibacterium sp.]